MNWFVITSGILWIGAAAQASYQGNWRLAVVGVCYACATFALEGIK